MNIANKSVVRKIFVVATVGALSLFSQVKAEDMFFRIDGIDGDSSDPKHSRWIDLTGFGHGAVQSVTAEENGRGVFDPVFIRHRVDRATPKFQEACMKGMRIGSGEIECCRVVSGAQTVVYKVSLEGIKIAEAHVTAEKGEDGSSQLFEEVKMLVNKETWTTRTFSASGDGAEPVVTECNSDMEEPENK